MSIFSSNSSSASNAAKSAAKSAAKPADAPHPNRRRTDGIPLSIVAPDMTIVGDLDTEGVVKIEGRVRGTVRAGAQVIIAQGAVIEGDLHAREAVVAGEVHGAIHASERVELQPTAAVSGDITTRRIAVLEGARVSGAVTMDVPALAVEAPAGAPGGKRAADEAA
ncbi:MAG TPA: polymer-forming cytoskeletal protein [Gemmatimonadales bacterium]|nr:polymer-forming cytoskeletal protein [Gemmatimonadales bacterium]